MVVRRLISGHYLCALRIVFTQLINPIVGLTVLMHDSKHDDLIGTDQFADTGKLARGFYPRNSL